MSSDSADAGLRLYCGIGPSPLARPSTAWRLALLPRCYQTIPNHADPCRTTSVPSVEILEPYIVVDLGGNACEITLNQRVQGSSP